MILTFQKYQAAGNDFIIIDNSQDHIILSEKQISNLCDRHFGIGADGLILLKASSEYDFHMQFYNSDGKEASMCGNGGRSIARFASDNKITSSSILFSAIDGLHEAEINNDMISLSMRDVNDIKDFSDGYFINTGSPHFVQFVESLEHINIKEEGRRIADEARFSPERCNVNFLVLKEGKLSFATFERGVEDETLACGTGATACAIAIYHSGKLKSKKIELSSKGGDLSVSFDKDKNGKYYNIKLTGPAKLVFTGEIII